MGKSSRKVRNGLWPGKSPGACESRKRQPLHSTVAKGEKSCLASWRCLSGVQAQAITFDEMTSDKFNFLNTNQSLQTQTGAWLHKELVSPTPASSEILQTGSRSGWTLGFTPHPRGSCSDGVLRPFNYSSAPIMLFLA